MTDYTNQIEEIVSSFDFEKVQNVMDFLNWEWRFDDIKEIPCISELEDTARYLLKEVSRGPYLSVARGGLLAECSDDGLSLSFVVEQWEA